MANEPSIQALNEREEMLVLVGIALAIGESELVKNTLEQATKAGISPVDIGCVSDAVAVLQGSDCGCSPGSSSC